MATTGGNGGPAPSASAPQGQAQLSVLGQYIKDFSFENPNAPRSLAPNQTQPAINIQINVSAQQLAQTDYEISLKLEGKAESAGTILFAFDLTFAGVFRVQNVPQETLQPLVMIDLRFCSTSLGWQLTVPQEMWATRKSPGLLKRMKSGDSWLSRV